MPKFGESGKDSSNGRPTATCRAVASVGTAEPDHLQRPVVRHASGARDVTRVKGDCGRARPGIRGLGRRVHLYLGGQCR